MTERNDKYEFSRISGYSMASSPLVSDLLTFTKMIFHYVNYTDNHQTLITPSKSCCRRGWPILIPPNSNKLSFRQHLVQKWTTSTLLFTGRKICEHLVAREIFWLVFLLLIIIRATQWFYDVYFNNISLQKWIIL